MKTIIVYDINLSPEAQPMDTEIGSEYRRVSTMLYTLSARGARVKYLNLHRDSLAFMDSPVVQQIMRTDGMDGFPCMTADEEIVVSGRYPPMRRSWSSWGRKARRCWRGRLPRLREAAATAYVLPVMWRDAEPQQHQIMPDLRLSKESEAGGKLLLPCFCVIKPDAYTWFPQE